MFWLFGAAVVAFLYPYVLFPAILAVVSRSGRRTVPTEAAGLPRVAVLVSAYNEAGRIRDKIGNFLASDYPEERVELWLGTDGSTDGTAGIVRAAGAPRAHLIERPRRSGKTAVLNDLASRANADVYVFTDVNAFFRPDTIRRLAEPFGDPAVGLVSGRTMMRGNDGQAEIEGAYYRFEQWLKQRESRGGWLAGADGAVYAIRASLYRELDPALINDLTHPCQVAALGFVCRFEELAVSEENAGDDAGKEFSRQTRMTAQAAYVLATQAGPLLMAGRLGQLWVLVSHKGLRWLAGLWLIAGTVLLPFLSLPAAAGAALIAAQLFAGWKRGAGWAKFPVYFLLVHAAYLNGLWEALRGNRYVVWKPREG